MDNAVEICAAVMKELGASPEHPVILNLPNTVEMCTPNTYADQIEYFIRHLPNRQSAIISIHPHNDRGTGVAAAELALLAGAERVEGTLFGNGERTGNLDIVNMGLNMYTQGVDPGLDFSNLPALRRMYEDCTKMRVHERHPYAGDLVFTAFSGSHQDAINKGVQYMKGTGGDKWEIPYLPIDPADIGREYEPIIRINSQSGKGGAAFVMQNSFGYNLPKAMHPEFGAMVKAECDRVGREISTDELFQVFCKNYLEIPQKYKLVGHSMLEESGRDSSRVHFHGTVECDGEEKAIHGVGSGPVDAFFQAIKQVGIRVTSLYPIMSTPFQAVRSHAIAYIELKAPNGKTVSVSA